MFTALSHGGQTLFKGQAAPTELAVGSQDGVVFLGGDGASWREASRSLTGRHVSALALEPVSGTLFAGTHGDGLHASTDGGGTWERRDTGIGYQDVYSLATTQVDGQTRVYCGTEPAHLYVSADLGRSWQELPALRNVGSVDQWRFPAPPHVAHVKHINFDPGTPKTIYASIEVGALLRSDDEGATWREFDGFYKDVHRAMIPSDAPDSIYITGGDGIYHSPDAGASWEHLTDRSYRISYPDGLVIHPEQPALMFVSGAVSSPREWNQRGTADPRIARSRDRGLSWEVLEQGLPEQIEGNIEALCMATYPGGFSLFGGTIDGQVFMSADGGDTWSTIAKGLPGVFKGHHDDALYKSVTVTPRAS